MTYTTGKKLLVTKPPDMDPSTDRGFREVERFVNKPSFLPVGIPAGGTTGQVLGKNSGTNYDVSWQTPSGGGGGGGGSPSAAGWSGGGVTFSTTTRLQMNLGTTLWDQGSFIDLAFNTFDIHVAGVYQIVGLYRIVLGSATADKSFHLATQQQNSSFVVINPFDGPVVTVPHTAYQAPTGQPNNKFQTVTLMNCSVGDTISFQVTPLSGVSTPNDAAFLDFYSIAYVGPGGSGSTPSVHAKVYQSGAVNTPSSGSTVFPWDTVGYDNTSSFNTSTHVFTAPVSGYYLLQWKIQVYNLPSGQWYTSWKNGTGGVEVGDATASSLQTISGVGLVTTVVSFGSGTIHASVNDQIRIDWNSSLAGGGYPVVTGPAVTYWMIDFIGL